jgi:hypothetical protein
MSPNAVRTQIRIAISIHVLVAIVKERLGTPLDLFALLGEPRRPGGGSTPSRPA